MVDGRGALHAWMIARPRVVDGLWALVLAGAGLLLTASVYASAPLPAYAATWQVTVAAAFLYAPLVARRRAPLTVLALVTLGMCLQGVWLVPESIFASAALFLAIHAVGDLSPRPVATWARIAAVAVLTLVTVGMVLVGTFEAYGEFDWSVLTSLAVVAMNAVFFAAAWLLGDGARERREREQLLAERNRELEAERAENARRAVLDERVRIARELHDVVAHSVSVMGIQAGAARRVLARDPDAAVTALGAIEQTSRAAVLELQRLLGFLRQVDRSGLDGADDRGPQPGVERLGPLVEEAAAAGLRTDLTVEGAARDLTSGLAVSVYRIVQEALTNTLRHAGAHKAEVLLRYRDDALEVEVLDDGRGPAPGDDVGPTGSGGHGLLGMRERVALHDGRLETGARPGGGYRVWARLPLPDPEPEPAVDVAPVSSSQPTQAARR